MLHSDKGVGNEWLRWACPVCVMSPLGDVTLHVEMAPIRPSSCKIPWKVRVRQWWIRYGWDRVQRLRQSGAIRTAFNHATPSLRLFPLFKICWLHESKATLPQHTQSCLFKSLIHAYSCIHDRIFLYTAFEDITNIANAQWWCDYIVTGFPWLVIRCQMDVTSEYIPIWMGSDYHNSRLRHRFVLPLSI